MIALLGLLCLLAVDTRSDADTLFSQGRYAEAANIYLSLIKASPSDTSLLLSMGQTLRAMHQPRQAIPFLLRDTQLAPKDGVSARALAAAMQEANEFSDDSVRFLTKLTESDPGGGEIWYRLGLLVYQNGYYSAALDDLDKALGSMAISDRNAAESARAISLMQVGRSDDAEQAFRGLLARPANEKNLDLLLAYARVLYESGRYESAMQMADRATAADANNASAHFWRARILLQEDQPAQQDRLKAAETEAERARDLAPGSPAPRNLLIRIYQKLGRSEDAAREADWVRAHQILAGAPTDAPPGATR